MYIKSLVQYKVVDMVNRLSEREKKLLILLQHPNFTYVKFHACVICKQSGSCVFLSECPM